LDCRRINPAKQGQTSHDSCCSRHGHIIQRVVLPGQSDPGEDMRHCRRRQCWRGRDGRCCGAWSSSHWKSGGGAAGRERKVCKCPYPREIPHAIASTRAPMHAVHSQQCRLQETVTYYVVQIVNYFSSFGRCAKTGIQNNSADCCGMLAPALSDS
jgi:hypothetical protein